ncbi:hypothetical protein FLA105534_03510 [Flavobacterium bizetiae]|uniref:Lipoprotein n=1 Tax=Flavobacterium bizetiae TaxID=2704140 RepID=A0A6J4GPU4_9FLAO|nr:hypothetical protein [Flavobacterium bizetiae]CAA9201278.1 hypothetical protein FLA105534_03510 [Flavobacterium bizetiae]CAD5344070.1 hypothetical protein FLA105535_04075 [Flavobacterium bizetiae]CAD5350074.1 hypothetical protein FLA105534_04064 [Flavobacterium bizetiae]
MKNLKLYSIILLPLLTSCMDVSDSRCIATSNKSKNSIYCFYLEHELNKMDGLPKYSFPPHETKDNEDDCNLIIKPRWEEYIKTCDNQKIRYYIIKKDSVDKYGWETIFRKNIYNKKYLFKIEDLDSLNWTITYDGD